jgi:hypothetical protein
MAFPTTLQFDLKKNAVKTALHQQVHYPITGSTANPLDVITFSLSCGKYGQYIDPSQIYLSYTFTNKDATNTIHLDGSGYSIIDRATVLSSGAVVSDLQNYGPWAQLMLDSQLGVGKTSTFSAFGGGGTSTTANIIRDGASVANSASLNISLPLMGTAIDSSSSDKMIPVGAISDLQLQLYISSPNNAVVSAAVGSWSLANISLTVVYVQLDAGAQKMLDDAQGGVYRWSGEQWKGYNFNLASTSSADNVIVPFKGASAKSVVAIHRNTNNINNYAAYTNLSRDCHYTSGSSWFVTIGSDTFPGIPLKNSTMHLVEYLKMWHGLTNPLALTTSIDGTSWVASDNTATTTGPGVNAASAGTFAAGLNLEAYSNKSGTIHSGVSVLGGTTMILNQTYSAALPAATLQTTYVHFDAIFSVENGQLTVAF